MYYKQRTGKTGEAIACKFLLERGYGIVTTNYRKKFGEIDIIATAPDKTLVFVEVKTIRSRQNVVDPRFGNAESGQSGNAAIQPEDNLTVAKSVKIKRMAEVCANEKKFQKLIKEDRGWRIDLLAITLLDDDRQEITHYENI